MPRPKKNAAKDAVVKKMVSATPTTLKGMKEILPKDQPYFHAFKDLFNELRSVYSFDEIETPAIENPVLFTAMLKKDQLPEDRGIAAFTAKGKQDIALRPEIRSSIARSVIVHNLVEPKEVKKFSYYGYTYSCEKERTQLQYRQSLQAGFEIYGEKAAAIDAHLIMVGYQLLKKLGIEAVVNINSIGDLECRAMYYEALTNYFKQYKEKFDADQKKLIKKNPVALLALKGKKYGDMVEGAPQIVDYLSEECKTHFFGVLEYLDDFDIPYNLDPGLMMDFDYYNRTVFELYPIKKGGELGDEALVTGGRYDYVVQKLGGSREIPASGVAFDVEKIVSKVRNSKLELPQAPVADIFIAQIGEQARRRAMVLFEELRSDGDTVAEGFVHSGLKPQLEIANRQEIPYVLVLGQKEVVDGTILFRDIESGNQEMFDLKKVMAELKKRIKRKK
jgi:histidyl-tRNA synthetase